MLDFIIFFLLWMAGGLFAYYGIITPLIVIRTANPLIHALEQKNLINAGAARKRNCLTIIIWLCIDAAVIGLMLAFANKTAWIGFAIGGIIFTAIGIGKTGHTQTNKEDFLQSYYMFFDSSRLEEVFETVTNY